MKDYATIIAIGSAAIAMLSAIVAIISAVTSRQTLALSKRQERDRAPDLRVDLVDAWQQTTEPEIRYAIGILVTNPQDFANSIVRIELVLRIIERKARRELETKVLLQPDFSPAIALADVSRVEGLPIQIPPRSSFHGWIAFTAPQATTDGGQIENLLLSLEDARENLISIRRINPRTIEFLSEREHEA